MSKDYIIITGIFDVITKGIRQSVLKKSQEGKPLGVGVYTDDYCENTNFSRPMKPVEHRMEIAQGLSGVDFTFPATSRDFLEIEQAADDAYEEYLKEVEQAKRPKDYRVGFLIGSFDLLHSGHLQNIRLASEMCQDLYVIVKTDERIWDRKHKHPTQNTTQRAANLQALKMVKGVLYYDLDSTRADAIKNVIAQYEQDYPGETIEEKDMVAFFGEDLREKEEAGIRNGEWGDVNLVFTPRPAAKMKKISSTAYKKYLEETGGLDSYEAKEAEGLSDISGIDIGEDDEAEI